MGDEQQRARVASSACSSCSIAGRSRWFVGSSSTRQLTPRAANWASDARVRSPGRQRIGGAGHVLRAEPELREERRASPTVSPVAATKASSSGVDRRRRARAWSSSPTMTPGPSHRSPASSGRRPSSGASSVVLPLPFAPTIATRSPYSTSRSSGPSGSRRGDDRAREPGDDVAAAGRGRDLHAQVPALPRLVDRVARAASRLWSSPWRRLARGCCGGTARTCLSFSPDFASWPCPARTTGAGVRARLDEPRAGRGSSRTPPRRGAARSPARRDTTANRPRTRWRSGVLVDLDDARDGAGQERAVVRHDEHAAGQLAAHEPFQAVEALEVEVVRRLVEQEDVEPAEQDRGESRGRLAARQRRHAASSTAPPDRDRRTGADPGVEVRPPTRDTARARRVRVVGSGPSSARRGRRVSSAARPRPHPCAAPRYVRTRLAGAAFRLLRQVAHRRAGRRAGHRAGVGCVETGEDPQQGRLPDAVGPTTPIRCPGPTVT